MATYIPSTDWCKVNQAIWYQVGSQTDDAVYTTGVVVAIQGPMVGLDNTLVNPTSDGTGVWIADEAKVTQWLEIASVRCIQYSVLSAPPTEAVPPATTTTAAYTQPEVDSAVIVPIVWQAGYQANQTVNVNGGGFYLIDNAVEPNLTLRNMGDVTNAAVGTVVPTGASVTVV